MQTTTTVGLDIAKSVFQVHGIDADDNVVFRRQLKRRYVLTFFQKLPPCLVGIEACAFDQMDERAGLRTRGHLRSGSAHGFWQKKKPRLFPFPSSHVVEGPFH